MEGWGHVTTAREIVRGEDSPVKWHSTNMEGTRKKMENQRQVSSNQSPHIGEWSGSKDDVHTTETRKKTWERKKIVTLPPSYIWVPSSTYQNLSLVIHKGIEVILWVGSGIVFESPVLELAKDCNQTGLRPNKTKTKKDCLLVFCSLGLGLFILEKSKRPKKTGLNRSFSGPIMYISTTILGLFLVILSYFFGIYSCRFSLTREYSTCHLEMWISPSFLGQTTWSNALNVAKGRYYNLLRHP